MITFKQLKFGPVGRASGLDVEGCDFQTYCNDAVRQLMKRGNWWSTVHAVTACVRNRVVTWPRGVQTILALNTCSGPTVLSNQWYQFVQPDTWHKTAARDYARSGWGGRINIETRNTSPVFNPILSEGFVIRTYITKKSDVGKTITFYGVDVNGQPIITQRPDGTIQDGIQVILEKPFVDTPKAIRHVSRVVKDETDGDLICYQYSVAGDFMLDLARYQPTEVNPEYITTFLHGHQAGVDCGCLQQISALVEVNFVPFKFDDDLVQIDCEDAIRDMFLSLRKKESGDIAGAFAYETSAIRELNFQMKRRYPDEQFVVNFRPFGNDSLENRNIKIGMI